MGNTTPVMASPPSSTKKATHPRDRRFIREAVEDAISYFFSLVSLFLLSASVSSVLFVVVSSPLSARDERLGQFRLGDDDDPLFGDGEPALPIVFEVVADGGIL